MFDLIKRNLLKYTLLTDGIVSIAAGAAFLGFAGLVSELVGPAFGKEVIMALGAFLFLWGLFHLIMSSRAEPSPVLVQIAIIGDALWMLGSAIVLAKDWNDLTAIGASFIGVMALAVADIMLLKIKGLGDQRRTAAA